MSIKRLKFGSATALIFSLLLSVWLMPSQGSATAAPANHLHYENVVPGIFHSTIISDDETGNQAIHLMKINTRNPFVGLEIVNNGTVTSKNTVSAMAAQHDASGHKVIGAVNLDFFSANGTPTGLQISDGEIITASNLGRTYLAVMADGSVRLGGALTIETYVGTDDADSDLQVFAVNKAREARRTDHAFLMTDEFGATTLSDGDGVEVLIAPEVPGTELKAGVPVRGTVEAIYQTNDNPIPEGKFILSASGSKADWIQQQLSIGSAVTFGVNLGDGLNDATAAVAGWSGLAKVLLHDGEIDPGVDDSSVNNVTNDNPRTFLASKNNDLYLVTFDGRQPGYADGVSLREGAAYLQALGMEEAINVDGGGSTTFLLRPSANGELTVMNSPSDGAERQVGNALLVVTTHPHFSK